QLRKNIKDEKQREEECELLGMEVVEELEAELIKKQGLPTRVREELLEIWKGNQKRNKD
ncbi:7775_t:CDS:1, partial [Gigaspora rosea]